MPAAASGCRASETVEIIVPARDEAANIGRCLDALLRQEYPAECLTISVIDDGSTDATAAIVATAARGCERLRLLTAPALPPGWTGKSHACSIAAKQSRAEWLCFLDADVFAEDALVATALTRAQTQRLAFLSLTPRQILGSFAERLVMPCGFYMLSFTQDLARTSRPEGGAATATGQFMLIRRSAYAACGGHAAVRDAISEDVALARRMKGLGHRVGLAGGDLLLATRMYTGWRTLWIGVSKNLVDMLGGPGRTIASALLAILLCWASVVLPLLDAVGCARQESHGCVALALAATGSTAALALHVAGAMYFKIPPWFGCLFPAGYTVGAVMALDSVRRRATGRTLWKGRTYP